MNSGPPPDPNALSRDRPNDKAGWRMLPVSGRQGAPPEWPLPADARLTSALELAETQREMLEVQIESGVASRGANAKLAKLDQAIAEIRVRLRMAAELEIPLWEQIWRTPQAIEWERLGWVREVALYVRLQVQAELGDLDSGKEARQWSDRLGLNPTALLRNRWRIVDAEPAATTTPAARTRTRSRSTARDRLKLVTDGDDATQGKGAAK